LAADSSVATQASPRVNSTPTYPIPKKLPLVFFKSLLMTLALQDE
jgi:hypothetical protein